MTLPYGVSDYGIKMQLKANNVPEPQLVLKYLKETIDTELRGYKTVKMYLESIARILHEIDTTID